jgi:flagellar M-ring protein FliF
MADASPDTVSDDRRFPVTPGRLVALSLTVLALLFALYWLFLRADYVPVFEGLSEADAAAVVAELEAQKLPHRLANGGTTILVDRTQADEARLRIASSELPLRGQIGFELFNESDMGLTEFAQKINYQRALQGEIARTIMLLDGIDNARVHLALPERTLFRGAQARPTAAVTLVLQPGHVITATRIAGIQRLVAGAVSDLAVGAVVITDDSGQLISADAPEASLASNASETEAVRAYYQARIANVLATVAPDLRSRIDITVRQRTEIALNNPVDVSESGANVSVLPAAARPGDAGSDAAANGRNYALLVTITTDAQLSDETRDQISAGVIAAADLRRDRADQLSFAVGPVERAIGQAPGVVAGNNAVVSRQPAEPMSATDPEPWWFVVALSALGAALLSGVAIFAFMQRRAKEDADPAEIFASQLKAKLATEGSANG